MNLGLKFTLIQWILACGGIISLLFFIVAWIKNSSDVSFAWRNTLRNKRRSALTLTAVAVAFAGNILLGNYFLGMFFGLRETTIRSETGHLQILKKDFLEYGMSSPTSYIIENVDEILAEIEKNEDLSGKINLIMKEVNYNGILSSRETQNSLSFLGRGVEISKDAKFSHYDSYISGLPLDEEAPYGIILGEGLAKQLKTKVDEEVTLLGTTIDGGLNVLDGTVHGIIRVFSKAYSNVVLKSSLEYAQEMIGSNGVNKIVFLLEKTNDTEYVRSVLNKIISTHPEWGVNVHSWVELTDYYTKVHTLFTNVFIVVSTMLFFLIIFLVANTMTMSIFERISEFGTLRSIGAKRLKLITIILLEGIIMGVLGVILGFVLTLIIGEIVQILQIEVPAPPGQSIGYPLSLKIIFGAFEYVSLVLISVVAIIGITVASSLYPAIKSSKLKIIDALRHI